MLHIHNGDAVANLAKRTAIPGDHVAFREALVIGPATRDLEARAQFLAGAYGESPLRTRNGLVDLGEMIEKAVEHDEVVLWFEHDLFCLMNLISLLARLEAVQHLSAVWTPEPLTVGDLPALFHARRGATFAMRQHGRDAWSAYASADPTALDPLLDVPDPSFPFLGEGFALHASRFPSVRNGLGAVEQRLLTLVTQGLATFPAIFDRFDSAPPRFGLGDAEVLRTLRGLASRPVPLLTAGGEWRHTRELQFLVTDAGRSVLAGQSDDIELNPPDFWLGGVHVTRENVWRWDEKSRKLIPSRPAG